MKARYALRLLLPLTAQAGLITYRFSGECSDCADFGQGVAMVEDQARGGHRAHRTQLGSAR